MSDELFYDVSEEDAPEIDPAYFEQAVTLTMTRKELGFLGSLIAYQGTQIRQQLKEFDVEKTPLDENPAEDLCALLETKFEMKNLLRIVLLAQGMPEHTWRSLHS